MKYFIVYQLTNLVNGKIYVGSHETDDPNDKYLGSGSYLRLAKEKHGEDNFKKEILQLCESRDEMYATEASIVNEEFVAREDTYNLKTGGRGGWDHINRSGLNLRTGAMWTEESRAKMSQSKKGQIHSSEAKKKIGDSIRGNEKHSKAVSNGLRGKQKSEEHKQKIRDAIKEWHRNRKEALKV